MSDTVEIKTAGLDQLLKALKAAPPSARVGILADRTMRSNTHLGETNAGVGASAEFGSEHSPMRSFLRVPITDNLQNKMDESGALDEGVLKEVIRIGTVLPWLKKVAVLAEGIVAEAFETGGFGEWPAWRNPDYRNNTGMLLVDTQQLRNSISSEVK